MWLYEWGENNSVVFLFCVTIVNRPTSVGCPTYMSSTSHCIPYCSADTKCFCLCRIMFFQRRIKRWCWYSCYFSVYQFLKYRFWKILVTGPGPGTKISFFWWAQLRRAIFYLTSNDGNRPSFSDTLLEKTKSDGWFSK